MEESWYALMHPAFMCSALAASTVILPTKLTTNFDFVKSALSRVLQSIENTQKVDSIMNSDTLKLGVGFC
jgi:hypothetical protein